MHKSEYINKSENSFIIKICIYFSQDKFEVITSNGDKKSFELNKISQFINRALSKNLINKELADKILSDLIEETTYNIYNEGNKKHDKYGFVAFNKKATQSLLGF